MSNILTPLITNLKGSLCLRAGTSLLLILSALAFCFLIGSFSEAEEKEGIALSFSSSSSEKLAKRVLKAVYEKDRKTLDEIKISRDEFKNILWPELPIGKIEDWQEHFDYVWGQHKTKSDYSLLSTLERFGGKKYSLKAIRFRKPLKEYETCRIHVDARLLVADSKGKESELNLFGSIVELNGGYKILSYNIH